MLLSKGRAVVLSVEKFLVKLIGGEVACVEFQLLSEGCTNETVCRAISGCKKGAFAGRENRQLDGSAVASAADAACRSKLDNALRYCRFISGL